MLLRFPSFFAINAVVLDALEGDQFLDALRPIVSEDGVLLVVE